MKKSGIIMVCRFLCRRVRTLYACMAENDGELSFEPNQIITNGEWRSLKNGEVIGVERMRIGTNDNWNEWELKLMSFFPSISASFSWTGLAGRNVARQIGSYSWELCRGDSMTLATVVRLGGRRDRQPYVRLVWTVVVERWWWKPRNEDAYVDDRCEFVQMRCETYNYYE